MGTDTVIVFLCSNVLIMYFIMLDYIIRYIISTELKEPLGHILFTDNQVAYYILHNI